MKHKRSSRFLAFLMTLMLAANLVTPAAFAEDVHDHTAVTEDVVQTQEQVAASEGAPAAVAAVEPKPGCNHDPDAEGTTLTYKEKLSIEAKCENNGTKVYKCSNCNQYVYQVVEKQGHVWERKDFTPEYTPENLYNAESSPNGYYFDYTAPSCSAEGSVKYHCKDCGKDSEAQTLDKTDHTYGETWSKLDDNSHYMDCERCGAAGRKTEAHDTAGADNTCSKCGYKAEEPVTHVHEKDDLVFAKKPATCTESGWKNNLYHCKNSDECDSVVTSLIAELDDGSLVTVNNTNDYKINALGHDYGSSEAYDITPEGHAKKCVRFDECRSVSDQVDPHEYGDKTPPENFEDATCTVCGYVYGGHVHKDHLTKHEKVLVSCPSGGTKEYYTCTCGKWFWDENAEQEIPEASREEDIKIAPADHTVTKYTHFNGAGDISRHRWVCDVCGGHGTQSCTYNDWTEKTAATCTTGTVQTRTCQKCGFVDERTLDDALGHAWPDLGYITQVTEWTENDDHTAIIKAEFTVQCSKCSTSITRTTTNVIPFPTLPTTEATCTENGYQYFRAIFEETEFPGAPWDNVAHPFNYITGSIMTEKLGHDLKEIQAVPAQCEKDGVFHHFECQRCNKLFWTEEDAENNRNEITDPFLVVEPMFGHDMNGPYEEDDNYHYRTCSICGKRSGPGERHTLVRKSDGENHWFDCSVCGGIEYQMEPHTESGWKSDNTGHWKECTVCGAITTEKTGHIFSTSSCTTPSTCTECGFTGEYGLHSWGNPHFEWGEDLDNMTCYVTVTCRNDPAHKAEGQAVVTQTSRVDADCFHGGSATFEATLTVEVDGVNYTFIGHKEFTTEKLEHVPEPNGAKNEPTCTLPGATPGTRCARCGLVLSEPEITAPPLGHGWERENAQAGVDYYVENLEEGTCVSPGTDEYTCAYCGEKKQFDSPILDYNHTLTEYTDGATINGGDPEKHYLTCRDCGYIDKELGYDHEYEVNSDISVGPEGCYRICTKCGHHSEVREHYYTTPSCNRGEVCVRCGYVKQGPLGHLWKSWEQIIADGDITITENDPYVTVKLNIHCQREGCITGFDYRTVYGTKDEAQSYEPTCTEDGLHVYNVVFPPYPSSHDVYGAPWDGKTLPLPIVQPATGHQFPLTYVAPDPADCLNDGVKGYWECGVCGAKFQDAEGLTEATDEWLVEPATGHNWSDWRTDEDYHWKVCLNANCPGEDGYKPAQSEYGMHQYEPDESMGEDDLLCSDCGRILKPGTGHKCENHLRLVPYKAATCTEEGNIAYYICDQMVGHNAGCGNVYLDMSAKILVGSNFDTSYTVIKVDPEAHAVEADLGKEPTCTEDGLTSGAHCSRCAKIIVAQQKISALGHLEVIDPYVEPNCQHAGKTEGSHCARCGVVLKEQLDLPQKEHQPVTIPGKQPTCTESGWTDGAYCQRCGMLLQIREPLDKLPHSYEEGWTSDSIGHWHVCTVCGDRGSYEGHTSSGPADENTAETCTVCGRVLTPALGHVHANHLTRIPAKAPSCTEEGNYAYYRCDCGALFLDYTANSKVTEEDVIIPKLAHIEVEIAAVNPTCTEPGWTAGVECFVCHTVLVEPTFIPATGHTIVEVPGKDATCTEPGLTAGKECSVCGFVELAQSEIPALGHDYVVTPGTEPTCTEPGVTEKKVCKRCNDTVGGETVDALGHDLEKVEAKEPTCTEAGNDEYFHCKRCGKAFSDADGKTEIETPVKEALGHAYGEDWTCDGEGHWHECERCGDKKDYAEHSSSGPADEGHDEHCTECGYVIAPATGHVHSLVPVEAVEPTCTEKGSIAYYVCQGEYGCGKLFSDAEGQTEIFEADTVVPAAGHKFGEWKVVEKATDSKNGREERTCTVCGTVESRTIAATGSATPSPKTGDEADLLLWSVLVLLSGTGMAVVLGKKRKFN